MRTKPIGIAVAALIAMLGASSPRAATVDGTVKVGGVVLDETGDRSAVQETYDIYDGFAVSQVLLNGRLDRGHSFQLDVRDANLDSRQGSFLYRIPRTLKVTASYDQHRQVFDPARAVTSERKNWKVGADYMAGRWFGVTGSFGYITRDGDRLPFPTGGNVLGTPTQSVLGTQYDNALKIGEFSIHGQKDRRGGAVSYRISDYSDDLNGDADRKGQVVSARLYAPSPLYDKWTHMLRGSYGVRKLSTGGLEYKMSNFQYTGVVEPVRTWQVRYRFEANRVDDQSTKLKTDRFQNDLDVTYFYPKGQLMAGYGYETNDDDQTLTYYNSWRAAATFRQGRWITAKVNYAGRIKNDQEDLTLLKDVEAWRVRGNLQIAPVKSVTFGGEYANRQRQLPDLDVSIDGNVISGFGSYSLERWGSVTGNYSFSDDEYDDRVGRFRTKSHIATGRAEFTRVKNLRLAGGVTYMDIKRDLNIEKSSVFAEGAYQVFKDYAVEVQYNVYNYDDYILLDRYYTANVVRFNLVYNLKLR
ncbi:MAG: hypothetical protein ACM3JJ_12770 [Hyphomicrobiales bacterium]